MLDILYEDDYVLFVNKPPNIVVQRGYDPDEPLLYDIAAAHTSPLFLLQRLDRGTSGVIFFSKSADVNRKLTRQFERKRIRKRYVALCEGELGERQTIDAPLKRTGAITFGVREDGKRAVTEVEPLSTTPNGSLVSITLHTGRTHQIRVHFSHRGFPLVGDDMYGGKPVAIEGGEIMRQALHAAVLGFKHPITGESMRFVAPLPEDLRNLIRTARQAGSAREVEAPPGSVLKIDELLA